MSKLPFHLRSRASSELRASDSTHLPHHVCVWPVQALQMAWPFANIGSTSAVLEAAASAIGAGLVVGGFAGGIAGVVLRWPRAKAERELLRSSYVVGALGLGLLVIDIVKKHFV